METNDFSQKEKIALLKRLLAETDKNHFDISIATGLCKWLGPKEASDLLTKDHKDIIVNSVESLMDFSEPVSPSLLTLYKFIVKEKEKIDPKSKLRICDADDLANLVTNRIYKASCQNIPFLPIDFAVIPSTVSTEELSLEEIANEVEGWFGIRNFDTGFDDEGLSLCVNYYGGGFPHFCYFDSDYFEEYDEFRALNLIYDTFKSTLFSATSEDFHECKFLVEESVVYFSTENGG